MPLWICGASQQGSIKDDDCTDNELKDDPELYKEDPYIEEELDQSDWDQTLASVGIFDEQTPTLFCDEYGNDTCKS